MRLRPYVLRFSQWTAFSFAPLQKRKQELDHVAVFQSCVPCEGKVCLLRAHRRRFEISCKRLAILAAVVQVLFQAFNFQIAEYQFHRARFF